MTPEHGGHEVDSDLERLRLALRRDAEQSRPSSESPPSFDQQTPPEPHEPWRDPRADSPARQLNPQALAVADMLLGADLVGTVSPPSVRVGGHEMSVGPDGFVIGRRSADLGIADGRVSRSHAELLVIDGMLHVRDLSSSNGTFVHRDRRIEQVGETPVALQPGDQVTTIDDVLLAEVLDGDPTRIDS